MQSVGAIEASTAPLDPGARAALLDVLPIALLIVDASDTVRYANDRAKALVGDAPVGRPTGSVLAPIGRLWDIVADAERNNLRPELEIERGGLDPLEVGIHLMHLPSSVAQPGWSLVTFQDIGWYQRLRRERDLLLKLATVGQVLPSILHELKNPLASVTSAVELLVEEAPPGDLQNDLHAILTEVRRMKLGFEGIGIAGRELRSTRNAAVDLALRQAVQVFQGRAEHDGITLRCEVPDLPLLPLDDAVVRALVFNLVSNALHACTAGDSVTVAARLDDGGRRLVLAVSDTGSGMSPESLAHCTELFFTTRSSGSGIGLALCKNTVDEAAGQFEITSEMGAGTTVRIAVPLGEDE